MKIAIYNHGIAFDGSTPFTPARQVHARWSGPLTLLQKTHDYINNGNVSAATRVLKTLERTPFLQDEVEAVRGKLSTWM